MFEDLKIYCAPLQGFTDYIWRNTHAEMFGGIDIYYTPFMRMVNGEIPKRDIHDILPENNTAPIRPQINLCANRCRADGNEGERDGLSLYRH